MRTVGSAARTASLTAIAVSEVGQEQAETILSWITHVEFLEQGLQQQIVAIWRHDIPLPAEVGLRQEYTGRIDWFRTELTLAMSVILCPVLAQWSNANEQRLREAGYELSEDDRQAIATAKEWHGAVIQELTGTTGQGEEPPQ